MKIVSGGQTGADRGALDAALALGLEHGGWCPRGRRAEDGTIPDRYRLAEDPSPRYHVRTERNVLDSDATLVLCRGELSGGTALTVRFAQKHSRPLLVVDLAVGTSTPAEVRRWLKRTKVRTLNVAGPRESQQPGIQWAVCDFLVRVLDAKRKTAAD